MTPVNPLAPPDLATRVRPIVTPEGVPLRFAVARAGDRAAAWLIDMAILALLLTAAGVVAAFGAAVARGWAIAVWCVAGFALRQGYFLFFEVRGQGTTPGKRWLGLQVIDRHGGALTLDALVARNLTREVETVIPALALAAPEAVFGQMPGWLVLLAWIWLGVFACLPLLNRDRLRLGDLIAGTLVVHAPRAVLLGELARGPGPAEREEGYTFTPAQLDVYGIFELQVLESVLRERAGDRAALAAVAGRIARKIGWDAGGDEPSPGPFLRAFYAAQRARLEARLLLGERRERKRDPGAPGPRRRADDPKG